MTTSPTPTDDMHDAIECIENESHTGRFLHTQCDHPLFSSEYLRSNKASGHKNLRCFPHCCGGHNPKSFCGAGLLVECNFTDCDLVLGRFEEHSRPHRSPRSRADSQQDVPPITVGQEYNAEDLLADVKTPDKPLRKWFRGSIHPPSASGAPRFMINGNRQSWHYGWQSSRLNCKNLHVFCVYFFRQTQQDDTSTLTCLADLSSPQFRISSSRKARKTFRPATTHPIVRTRAATESSIVPNATPRSVPSIDQLLTSTQESASTPVATSTGTGYYYTYRYTAPNANDAAARDRKRLTRSASSKSDYYTSVHFPSVPSMQMGSTSQQPQGQASAYPFGVGANASLHQSSSVAFLQENTRMQYNPQGRRSSLAALPTPLSSLQSMPRVNETPARPSIVTTPVAGMNSLNLESPSTQQVYNYVHTSPPSSSAEGSVYARRGSLPSRMSLHASSQQLDDTYTPPQTSTLPTPPTYTIPAPLTQDIASRKRNRSSDSDRAVLVAVDGMDQRLDTRVQTQEEDLYRRARVLQLAFVVLNRIHKFEERARTGERGVIRHSFVMIETLSKLVEIPLSNNRLQTLCTDLVVIAQALVQENIVARIRKTMRESVQRGESDLDAYATVVRFLDARVHEQVDKLPRRQNVEENQVVDLYTMLKEAEPWLAREHWWRSAADQDTTGSLNASDSPMFAYFSRFVRLYDVVKSSLDIENTRTLQSLHGYAWTGDYAITGEWTSSQSSYSHMIKSNILQHGPHPPMAWIYRHVQAHMTSCLSLIETRETFSVQLPHSWVAKEHAINFQLNASEPVVTRVPKFYPSSDLASDQTDLVVYRAWRVRELSCAGGSEVAVQFMRWPEDPSVCLSEGEEPEEEPKQLKRHRVTIYFSVIATNRLQLRTIIEASAQHEGSVALGNNPTDSQMQHYFKMRSSWELVSQFLLQYAKA